MVFSSGEIKAAEYLMTWNGKPNGFLPHALALLRFQAQQLGMMPEGRR